MAKDPRYIKVYVIVLDWDDLVFAGFSEETATVAYNKVLTEAGLEIPDEDEYLHDILAGLDSEYNAWDDDDDEDNYPELTSFEIPLTALVAFAEVDTTVNQALQRLMKHYK